jgi:hypothetical protein
MTRDIYEGIYSHIKIDVSDSFNPVPIPGAVWLLGSGLFGLLGFKNIRRWHLGGRTTQPTVTFKRLIYLQRLQINTDPQEYSRKQIKTHQKK